MNELEKKMHDALSPLLSRDDAARAAAKIAIEEIKAAFMAGYIAEDGEAPGSQLQKYLKQKGYE